jgi:hypothetical protein
VQLCSSLLVSCAHVQSLMHHACNAAVCCNESIVAEMHVVLVVQST